MERHTTAVQAPEMIMLSCLKEKLPTMGSEASAVCCQQEIRCLERFGHTLNQRPGHITGTV